jgi:signal transduction histidine kinase
VLVEDDGIGFDPAAPVTPSADGKRGGMGLRSMRERASRLGGTLEVQAAPDEGTHICTRIPV